MNRCLRFVTPPRVFQANRVSWCLFLGPTKLGSSVIWAVPSLQVGGPFTRSQIKRRCLINEDGSQSSDTNPPSWQVGDFKSHPLQYVEITLEISVI